MTSYICVNNWWKHLWWVIACISWQWLPLVHTNVLLQAYQIAELLWKEFYFPFDKRSCWMFVKGFQKDHRHGCRFFRNTCLITKKLYKYETKTIEWTEIACVSKQFLEVINCLCHKTINFYHCLFSLSAVRSICSFK